MHCLKHPVWSNLVTNSKFRFFSETVSHSVLMDRIKAGSFLTLPFNQTSTENHAAMLFATFSTAAQCWSKISASVSLYFCVCVFFLNQCAVLITGLLISSQISDAQSSTGFIWESNTSTITITIRLRPASPGCSPPSMLSIVVCQMLFCSRWFPPSFLFCLVTFCSIAPTASLT